MTKETIDALTELAKAAARSQGLDDSNIEFTVCNTTEPNVCETHCENCEGQTHHWVGKTRAYACEHCDHQVAVDAVDHPSGCDCPNCDPAENWLCACGNFMEEGYHCDDCGREPPWGCPCSFCEDGDEEDFDYSDYGIHAP